VCDAVAAGRISAVLACERFGSASRGEKAYKAGYAYGRPSRDTREVGPCNGREPMAAPGRTAASD
jgi:hypothetical protein